MREYKDIIAELSNVAENPKLQMDKFKAQGTKMVGVLPYFCPEELVYAAGAIPFGLWGAEMQVSEAKRYFPAFYCSILQTVLEMGIRGDLNDLSAVMIPIVCDSLKGMGINWEAGVPQIPVINVAIAENRKIAAGVEFTRSQFAKNRKELENLFGIEITDVDIKKSIAAFNENRRTLREFNKIICDNPGLISPLERNRVIKAGYFMDKKEHTALVGELNESLKKADAKEFKGIRLVTTGIIADSKDLLNILADNNMVIVDDQIAHESINYREDTPITADPIVGMAERLSNVEGCSVLHDLGKKRNSMLIELVKASKADGVLFVLTKFCDPEEYDYVPLKRALEKEGIPLLQVEIDQQMENYEQARNAIEAFKEILQ